MSRQVYAHIWYWLSCSKAGQRLNRVITAETSISDDRPGLFQRIAIALRALFRNSRNSRHYGLNIATLKAVFLRLLTGIRRARRPLRQSRQQWLYPDGGH